MSFRSRVVFWFLCPLFCLLGVKPVFSENPLPIKTVFIILMENHDWSTIIGTTNCPYINNTLLPMSSYCRQYYNPPGLHPSQPNYIWLEAGTNFGILNNNSNQIHSSNHLVTLLNKAGISWKSYQENMTNPLVNQNDYVVRHDPMVLFADVSTNAAYMTSHVRPYTDLAGDLRSNTVARYNFITPALTNDMHDAPSWCTNCSSRVFGDKWLAQELPKILNSHAYSNNGAIFIAWDEGSNDTSDGPIGMIVLSPAAKGHRYANSIHYTHSSTLRTMQNIFGVRPYLGDAANSVDLSDLFVPLQLTSAKRTNNFFRFTVNNVAPDKTTYVQTSSNLINWVTVQTNIPTSSSFDYTNNKALNSKHLFYRVVQPP